VDSGRQTIEHYLNDGRYRLVEVGEAKPTVPNTSRAMYAKLVHMPGELSAGPEAVWVCLKTTSDVLWARHRQRPLDGAGGRVGVIPSLSAVAKPEPPAVTLRAGRPGSGRG